MANITYTGSSSASPLIVTSSAVDSPPDHRELTHTPGSLGLGVAGYDLMTYQRLTSALYAQGSPPSTHGGLEHGPSTVPAASTILSHTQDVLLHGAPLELRDGLPPLGSGPWPYPVYYPYDTLASYPFASGYGMAFDAARRKNATRETTATLKAWLNEHKKNPYPTKGEKIMLAIITKMTLTQVSTWFANARRRLKKENKMTWEPRNKTDEDDEDDDERDDENADKNKDSRHDIQMDHQSENSHQPERLISPSGTGGAPANQPPTSPVKPRIWSLADMAASSSTPSAGKIAAHRTFHLDTSPYGRPLSALNHKFIPQETLLQVYAKSLGLATPHAAMAAALHPLGPGLNGLATSLSPSLHETPLPSSLVHSPNGSPSMQPHITRPLPTRPLSTHSPTLLPGGAKISPASSSIHRPEG